MTSQSTSRTEYLLPTDYYSIVFAWYFNLRNNTSDISRSAWQAKL